MARVLASEANRKRIQRMLAGGEAIEQCTATPDTMRLITYEVLQAEAREVLGLG